MRRSLTFTIAAWMVALATVASALPALAQSYPSKPIRMIVAYPPGASTDLLARSIAQLLGERLEVPVVVENRAGASGLIGTEAVARAAPDGYTLLFSQQDNLTLLPILRKDLRYNPEKDLVPVAKVGDVFLLIASSGRFPATTLKQAVDIAKARPGAVKFSSAGTGGINHLVLELLQQRAGIELLHVPYKGGADAVLGLLAGDVDLFGGSAILLAKSIEAGKIHGLAIAQDTRSALLPSVPTASEAGFPDFVVSAYFGVVAPAGTPDSILGKLSDDIVAVASTPEFRAKMTSLGVEGTPLGRAGFAAFLANESKRWKGVIEAAKIQVVD